MAISLSQSKLSGNNEVNLDISTMRKENASLQDQVQNLNATVKEQRKTIAVLESYKASLITSLRILQQNPILNPFHHRGIFPGHPPITVKNNTLIHPNQRYRLLHRKLL